MHGSLSKAWYQESRHLQYNKTAMLKTFIHQQNQRNCALKKWKRPRLYSVTEWSQLLLNMGEQAMPCSHSVPPPHHTYHQRGRTKYLSKGVQSKLSIGRGSVPKKGRRDQVNAEEHNFCVSESKGKRLYIHPTQIEVKGQWWQWQFDWKALVQKHWEQGPPTGAVIMLYPWKKRCICQPHEAGLRAYHQQRVGKTNRCLPRSLEPPV